MKKGTLESRISINIRIIQPMILIKEYKLYIYMYYIAYSIRVTV